MNMILFELKSNLKGFLIWSISLSLLFFAASFEYEAFSQNEAVAQALDSFDFLFKMIAGTDSLDLTTPEGYLSLVSFYIYLPLAIYGGLLGATIVSKEERDKTAEYLFTLPIKREQVLVAKMVVSFIYVIVMTTVVMGGVYIFFGRLGTSASYNRFILNMGIGVLLIQFIFLSIGLVLSAMMKQYKKSGAVIIAILLVTYMFNMVLSITDKVDFLKYVIPFQYYNVNHMLEGHFDLVYLLLTVLIVGLSLGGLFYFYKKRDLYI